MKTFYKQCTLKQDNTTTVMWLPEKYAKMHRRLSLKTDDVWSKPWDVVFVSPDKTDNPPDYRKLIRSHREATGDNLPKLKGKKKKKG